MKYLILLVLLVGCGNIPIKNKTVYVDKAQYGAHYHDTLKPNVGNLTKEQWDKIRPGMFCVSSDAFSDGESAVDTFCQQNPIMCTYEDQVIINKIFFNMKDLHNESKKIKNKLRAEQECIGRNCQKSSTINCTETSCAIDGQGDNQ